MKFQQFFMFKLFLIRIGKVISVSKKEGIWNGVSKAFSNGVKYLGMLFNVGSGEILFVAGGVMGDSALYRVHHQLEELRSKGFKCSATVQDNPFLLKYVDRFQIFVFQRVYCAYPGKILPMIREIEKRGKEVIFETDDLLFDAKYFKYMDYVNRINVLEGKLYEKGIGEEILKNPYVKTCTTTTSYLAEKIESYGKRVFIVKNKLSQVDVEIANEISKSKVNLSYQQAGSQKSKVKLGYFSGTSSHNKDFATISDALLEIMEKYSNVELFLAGPLDIESKLNKFSSRIKKIPYVKRKKHFENISKIDINLAPLEMGNPFCEAKSELKFFEAGIVGVPTVASATQTFKEAISDGIDGFVASNTDEWKSKLEKLILNPEMRFRMGQEARKKTLEDYTIKNSHSTEYYEYLRNKI